MTFVDLPVHPNQPTGTNSGREEGGERPLRFLTEVGDPRLLIVEPDPSPGVEPLGVGVVICPGGGYRGVSFDKEGLDFARRLASWGLSCAVLLYRQPGGAFVDPPHPLVDLRRALEVCRARWSLDPSRLGVMGFSAGGHLAWSVVREPGDAPRPGFTVLGYPVVSLDGPLAHQGSRDNLLGTGASGALVRRFSGQYDLPPGLGPTFLVHAEDDGAVPVGNSLALRDALDAQGAEVKLVLHPTGGHGFGFGPEHGFATAPDWSPALHLWLREHGWAR